MFEELPENHNVHQMRIVLVYNKLISNNGQAALFLENRALSRVDIFASVRFRSSQSDRRLVVILPAVLPHHPPYGSVVGSYQ